MKIQLRFHDRFVQRWIETKKKRTGIEILKQKRLPDLPLDTDNQQ
jgi:hypothetical protein